MARFFQTKLKGGDKTTIRFRDAGKSRASRQANDSCDCSPLRRPTTREPKLFIGGRKP